MTISVNNAVSGALGPSTAAITNPTVTASPYTYTNTSQGMQLVVIVGGTVSATGIVRGGTTAVSNTVAEAVALNPNDGITITYSVAPTLSVFQLL